MELKDAANDDTHKLFLDAASRGNMATLCILYESDVVIEVDRRGCDGMTAMMHAARNNQVGVAAFLLDHGADINAGTRGGETALHIAVYENHAEMITLLISRRSDSVLNQNGEGATAFLMACGLGLVEMAAVMVTTLDEMGRHEAKQAMLDMPRYDGVTPIFASTRCSEIVQLLVDNGAWLESKDARGRTALYAAVLRGGVEMVQYLLTNGADIEAKDTQGSTPLIIAAAVGRVDTVRLLLDYNASIHTSNERGATALHFAVDGGDLETIVVLIHGGVDVLVRGVHGRTPFFCACARGGIDQVEVMASALSEMGAVNTIRAMAEAPCDDGSTPLIAAALHGHHEIVKFLLLHGVSFASTSFLGSVLHVAAAQGHDDIVEYLVAKGSDVGVESTGSLDVDQRNSEGLTAMMQAAANGHIGNVIFLIEHGAALSAQAGQGETALHLAVDGEHEDVVELLIRRGASVVIQDINGVTPFLAACGNDKVVLVRLTLNILDEMEDVDTKHAMLHTSQSDGGAPITVATNAEIVHLLITHGASVERTYSDGLTALTAAARRGVIESVKSILATGADIDGRGSQGRTPLMNAAFRGHEQVVDYLLEHNASVAVPDEQGLTALHYAAHAHNAAIVGLLISGGADLLVRSARGRTALCIACQNGNVDVVIAMVEGLEESATKRAMLETPDIDGWTPLVIAAHGGHLEVVIFLIHHGVSVKAKSVQGFSSLHVAAQQGHHEVVEYLLTTGADIEATTADKVTPLMCAASKNHLDVVAVLVENGASLESKTVHGCTALLTAVSFGHYDLARCFVERCADIDTTDLSGITPLSASICSQHFEITRLLLDHKADVNIGDLNGFTPLMKAAREGYTDIARALLDAGARPNVKAKLMLGGTTAMLAAAQFGNYDVVELLLQFGASVNGQGYLSGTPFLAAAAKGHSAICDLLIKHKADISERLFGGMTALHLAIVFGQSHIVKLLVEAGIDVNTEDYTGLTPAYCAAMRGDFEVVEYLESCPGVRLTRGLQYQHIWSVAALRECYADGDPSKLPSEIPKPSWFIDRAAIVKEAGCPVVRPTSRTFEGTWLGAAVDVVEPIVDSTLNAQTEGQWTGHQVRSLFVNVVNSWMPLNHPNVVKLFGAFHREQPFLVVEHVQKIKFRTYLRDRKDRTWWALHQVALGLRYLHERGIFHGRLRCDAIVIGDDERPKILHKMHALDRSLNEEHWQSQTDLELMPSSDGDVHSLAMCIIEVLTDDLPYAQEVAEGKNVAELVRSKTLPRKHPKICDRVWDLITRMAMTDHFSGQKLPDVIAELEVLVREEEYSERTEVEYATSLTEIAELLGNARHLRDEMSILKESSEFLVLSQLEKSAEQFNVTNLPTTQVTDLFRMVLKRYIIVLENQRDMPVAKSYAAGQQHANAVFLMYDHLDRLLEQLKESPPTVYGDNGQPVRKWRETWHASRLEQLKLFTELLENIDSKVGGSAKGSSALDVETQTCLLFELTQHRMNYPSVPMKVATKACVTLRSSLGRQLPDWFLPQYEVEKSGMTFSKGGFGAVYHGKWMGSEVVVKQCHVNDVVAFEREVEIWYKLYHPHVVKFLGASHVGQLLFVSEYAAQGQLDQYLRKGHRHEVWQKLQEAALGLQYLHLREVTHCDLKCNNILIGSDGKAKLTDFGLSSSQQGLGLKPGDTTFGNVRWAAPEVLRGVKPSPESDVYAFGMCIVEAVSGELPYATTGGDKNAVISVHVKEGGFVDRPASFRYDPHWALVLQCCHKNPSERVNVGDLVQRLEQFAVQAVDDIDAVEVAKDAGCRWPFNEKTEGAGNDTSLDISDAEDTSRMSISGASSRGDASYDAASVSEPVSELSTFK